MKPRRILMAGDFWFGATGAGLAHGLRALGHVVSEVSLSHYFMTGGGLARRAASRVLTPLSIANYRRDLLAAAVRDRPDMLLAVKGSFLSPRFLAKLQAMGMLLINYFPDFSFNHDDFSSDWFHAYDLVVTTKDFQLPWFAEHMAPGSYAYVPHGYSSLVHRRALPRPLADAFDYDISYAGNASPAKVDWLAGLATRHPGRSVLIVGNGWNADPVARRLAGCQIEGPRVGDVYARTLERSRINIAMHYGPRAANGWEDTVSTRTFEIPACGGFMLHIDSEDVRALYAVGREVDVFSTRDELDAKIEFYLEHHEERMRIAAAGHARAVPAYSYDARAAEIMELVDKRSR